MATKRKGISKKIRFEVFKRDSFTCQYCGRKAPDVVLAVDHIKPVKTGGINNILNYITSCVDCNIGKGCRELSDSQVVSKQMDQLELLNEKREQLEMIYKWKQGLLDLGEMELNKSIDYFKELTGWSLTDCGKKMLKPLVKKYGLSIIIDSMNDAYNQYAPKETGGAGKNPMEKVFEMVGKIANVKNLCQTKPYMKDVFYCRGILQNRFSYVDRALAGILLEQSFLAGNTIEEIKSICLSSRNWTDFKAQINLAIGSDSNG